MDLKKIAIAAIKEEAISKKDEKIFICNKLMSYKELAELVEKGQNKEIIKYFLDPYIVKLKTSTEFRVQVLAMLGMSNSK